MRNSSNGLLYSCSACGEDLPAADFSFSDETRRVLNSYCRRCHAAYRRAHYLANKPRYVQQAIAQMKGRRARNRRGVLIYLASHPCVDCNAADPIVLEFDHRDRLTKLAEVNRLIINKPWARVLAEIEKCDVRCINCHRRKTARQFNWAKASPVE